MPPRLCPSPCSKARAITFASSSSTLCVSRLDRNPPEQSVHGSSLLSGAAAGNRGWATSGCPGLGRAPLQARASLLGFSRHSAATGIAPSRMNAAATAIAGRSRAPWPSGRGSPRAKPCGPLDVHGTTDARAAFLLDPPPPVVACHRWPPPQSPASVARRPRATSAHTASARGRVSQPRSRPAPQSPSPAAARRGRPFPAAPLFSPAREEEDRRLLSLCLSLAVNDKWVQVCSGSRRSALRVAENGYRIGCT
jgi:hypothetical protein